jgi:hypothetical protein
MKLYKELNVPSCLPYNYFCPSTVIKTTVADARLKTVLYHPKLLLATLQVCYLIICPRGVELLCLFRGVAIVIDGCNL